MAVPVGLDVDPPLEVKACCGWSVEVEGELLLVTVVAMSSKSEARTCFEAKASTRASNDASLNPLALVDEIEDLMVIIGAFTLARLDKNLNEEDEISVYFCCEVVVEERE